MGKLSKCFYIGGVGFVNLPCAKVSAASRKLYSSCHMGSGTPSSGIRATRSASTDAPVSTTERGLRRARLEKAREMARKRRGSAEPEALCWKTNIHVTTAITWTDSKISSRFGERREYILSRACMSTDFDQTTHFTL